MLKTNFVFRILPYLGILMFFFSGTIYITDVFAVYQRLMIVASILLLAFTASSLPKFTMVRFTVTSVAYVLFVFFIAFSFLFNTEAEIWVSVFGLIAIWITATFFIPQVMSKYNIGFTRLIYMLIASQLLFLLYSFAMVDINVMRYTGIFHNSNGVGTTAVTLGVLVLSAFLTQCLSKDMSFTHMLLDFALLFFSAFVALISNSRGACATLVSLIAVMLVVLLTHLRRTNKKQFIRIIQIMVIILIACIAVYVFTDVSNLIDKILNKFQYYSDDPLNRRQDKWGVVLNRLKFFGNGEIASFGAHSTYFNMLDQYGVIPFFSLILFVMSGVWQSLRRSLSSKNINYKVFFPLFSFLGFGILALVEGMMLKTIMLLAVFSTVFINENTNLKY